MLSNWRWYRRLMGGTWYNVTPYFAWYIAVWVRPPAMRCERINAIERVPGKK